MFWWRKVQVYGEQVPCGLSFVLFAWNENTCNHRCKSKSRIFYASFLHLCQSYHFLIPSSFMSLWHNNVKHVPCILCCIHFSINNLGKIEGGRGYEVNFQADLICCLVTWFGWSAGVWCKNQEEACSDSRKPVVALPMKHTVYNSLSLNCIIFRVEIEALCIHCYTVLVCSINNSLSRHFPTLTYFIQPRCWFHHKVKYKLSNFFYIYYLPEKIFHL